MSLLPINHVNTIDAENYHRLREVVQNQERKLTSIREELRQPGAEPSLVASDVLGVLLALREALE